MHTCIIWRNFNVFPFTSQHETSVDHGIGGACWKMFHDISKEFQQIFFRWEWKIMKTRLHDELWCKHGCSQRLCGHVNHPWALKPSHTMKACVLSKHVKFLMLMQTWMSCILESWNPPTPWRHMSSLTMSNFDAYRHDLNEFQRFPIHCSSCGFIGSWHYWWACWKMLHDSSIEFRQRFCRWEWWTMTMRLHDECWCKHGRSQWLCRNIEHPRGLKPSHTVKKCFLSNHAKFQCIQAQFGGISTLAPFTAQCATSVDHGIGDGIVGIPSITFQESFDKYSIDGNGNWWQWDYMMNIDENVDDLKDYMRMP